MFSGANSQWNLGDFSPNFKNNPNLQKKIYCDFFFFEDWDFHSVNTHIHYMVTFSFTLMAIVCVIHVANVFFIDQN